MTDELPLLIDPVIAWRGWMVDVKGDDVWLRSVVYAIRWPLRRPIRSHCLNAWAKGRPLIHGIPTPLAIPPTVPRHDAPYTFHTCGVYGVATPPAARSHIGMRRDKPAVLGEVALWGHVIEGDKGWRAEYAYPRRLWMLTTTGGGEEDLAPALEEAYGVPVGTVCRSASLGLDFGR